MMYIEESDLCALHPECCMYSGEDKIEIKGDTKPVAILHRGHGEHGLHLPNGHGEGLGSMGWERRKGASGGCF
jgi:hypothetical protein